MCWGINVEPVYGRWYGQASPPKGEHFTTVSAGTFFNCANCALRLDGTPSCWGKGYDTPEPERIEYEAVTDEKFVSIGTGWGYSCGLRKDGTTVCWGEGSSESGRWGDYGREWPPEGERFTAISTGTSHTCGLRQEDSTAVCWGENTNASAFPPKEEGFAQLASGNSHTCGLRRDGSVQCWGWLSYTSGANILPSPPQDDRFAAIESGSFHVCALREDGSPVCWGDNEEGQASPPVGQRFSSISAGARHTCALSVQGAVVCWGQPLAEYESRYQFGQASPPLHERFVSISSGAYHTCAVTERWGAQLGDEGEVIGQTGFGQSSPPESERFSSISSGGLHTCALRQDGTPFAGVRGSWHRTNPRDIPVKTLQRHHSLKSAAYSLLWAHHT